MTRDFNKPRRDDDTQPSSRHTPSGNSREEQPFKPARPRLSRETVDRAWENGAANKHADYRPRQNAPRPPYQAQGRPASPYGRPQTPQNRPGYGARQENYRGSSSPSSYSGGYQQRREQGPEASRRPFNSAGPNASYPRREQGPETGRRPFNSSGPNSGYQRREQGPETGRRPFNNAGPNSSYQRREQGPEANRRPFNNAGPNSGYPRREQGPETGRRPFNGPGPNSGYQRHEQGPETGKRPFNRPGYQPGERSFESSKRPFNESEYRHFSSSPDTGNQRREQGPEAGEHRFNEPGNRAPGGQPGFQGERYQRGPAQPYRGGEGRYQDARPPRFNQAGPGGPAHPNYRSESEPRPFEHGDRERGNFRSNRLSGPPPQRDSHNPRWQSRPTAQREYRSSQAESEQFEGDYERFDSYQGAKRAKQPEYEEQHVTRLPDGRVLKGSRPSQNKQARFWNGVAEESSSLIANASPAPTSETPEQVMQPDTQVEKPARPKARTVAKPKAVRTVKTTLSRGTGGMKSVHGSKTKALKKKIQGPQTPGTRPSRRGYKWPAPGEAGE